ncbi:MAG TPA: glycoside hydrolase family 1 protein, partial [Candidatus Paceibacterota bacterium]|nr:glycoside hydrolase family 1 protein [Candidatus Paceibacterota bacterium]
VMLGVCKGIVETTKAIRAVDDENVLVHVDATDLYETANPDLAGEVSRRQEIVFLALDLISGRVGPDHSLHSWLLSQAVSEKALIWFQENPAQFDLVGINLYPLFSRKVLERRSYLRIKMPYAEANIVERLAELYFERYQVPIFISETASLGNVKRRARWLVDSVESTRHARSRGIPLVGYTWWPLFALVTWAYRQGRNPPAYYLKQMGLWDLRENNGLERVATPLVDQYKQLVAAKNQSVGTIARHSSRREVLLVP